MAGPLPLPGHQVVAEGAAVRLLFPQRPLMLAVGDYEPDKGFIKDTALEMNMVA